ncbi:MAG: TonB-dependent receptor [Bacteroidales bacterium]|nr:TonB-dependent receptor [Bacteroidales bacterium]
MSKRKILLKLIGLFPVTLTLGLSAQYNFSGTVTGGEDKALLPGAHIIIDDGYRSTVSDAEGAFFMENISSGEHRIRVSFVGYRTYNSVQDFDRSLTMHIHLESKPVMEDEIVVFATRASERTPATFVNIEKKEIERMNQGKDLPYLLESSPSMVATSDAGAGVGYTNFRIRGTDLTRINVTVNGIPLNDPESQGVWFVDLPDFASSIDNLQIQRGVGTSSNGASAFGASINIQTQKPSAEPYGEIHTAAGSFNTYRQSVKFGTGHIKSRWAFDGRLSSIISDGYVDRASSNLASMFLSGSFIGRKTVIKANLIKGKEKTYQAWMGIPPAILDTNRTYNPMGKFLDKEGRVQYYENQTDNYLQDHYHLIANHILSDRLMLNATLFYIKGRGYYEEYQDAKDPWANTSFSSYGLENVVIGNDTVTQSSLIRQLWMDNGFYGLVYSLKYENKNKTEVVLGGGWNNYEGDHYGKVIWAEYAGQGTIDRKWYENTGKKSDLNVYGKINVPIHQKHFMFIDLQYRHINYRINGTDKDLINLDQKHLYDFFNPRLGATFNLRENQKAFISFAISNREPNRYNFTDTDPGRPAPLHETLYNIETGYSTLIKDLSLGANVFWMDYKNQLVLTGRINDIGNPVMENVPDSYRAGIEISTAWNINDRILWKVNATWSQNRINNYNDYVVDFDSYPYEYLVKIFRNTDIAFSPALIINSEAGWRVMNHFSVSLISKYVGRQYIDNTSSSDRKLDPWFVNDILLQYDLSPAFVKAIGFTLRCSNVFDVMYESNAWVYRYYAGGSYYEDAGYFPQAGFHIMAGVNIKF